MYHLILDGDVKTLKGGYSSNLKAPTKMTMRGFHQPKSLQISAKSSTDFVTREGKCMETCSKALENLKISSFT